jgi:hypothetical protein
VNQIETRIDQGAVEIKDEQTDAMRIELAQKIDHQNWS